MKFSLVQGGIWQSNRICIYAAIKELFKLTQLMANGLYLKDK